MITDPANTSDGINVVHLKIPHRLKLPTGSSKFLDVFCMNISTSYVQTDKGVYFMDMIGNEIPLNPFDINLNLSGLPISHMQGTAANGSPAVVNEYRNKSDILSAFTKISYISGSKVFALTKTGKAYAWGNGNEVTSTTRYPAPVLGLGYTKAIYVPFPIPIRTGTLDPYNPSKVY